MRDRKQSLTPSWSGQEIPKVLTYIYPAPQPWEPLFQFHWDYQVEWPEDGRPRIKLLRFRSFQSPAAGEKAVLVEDITDEIPINSLILMNISQHAAACLYAYACWDGDLRVIDRAMFDGAEEAARKGFNLASYRKMAQANPKPELV